MRVDHFLLLQRIWGRTVSYFLMGLCCTLEFFHKLLELQITRGHLFLWGGTSHAQKENAHCNYNDTQPCKAHWEGCKCIRRNLLPGIPSTLIPKRPTITDSKSPPPPIIAKLCWMRTLLSCTNVYRSKVWLELVLEEELAIQNGIYEHGQTSETRHCQHQRMLPFGGNLKWTNKTINNSEK